MVYVFRSHNDPSQAEHMTVRHAMLRVCKTCLDVIWVIISNYGDLSVCDENCDLCVDRSCAVLQRARHPHHKPPWGSKPLYQIAVANNLTLITSLL